MHFAIEAVSPAALPRMAREQGARASAVSSGVSTVALPAPRRRARTLASTDHKRIAGSACAIAFVFFLAGGLLALMMRTQLAADGGVVSQQIYNELFTMHGSTMVYLLIVPVALAAGLYLVPLQVGRPRSPGRGSRSRGCGCLVLRRRLDVVGLSHQRRRRAAPRGGASIRSRNRRTRPAAAWTCGSSG